MTTQRIELNAPEHLISLATSGYLISVEVSVYTGTKRDRALSEELTSAKKAASDTGDFTKKLLAHSPEHHALVKHRQTVYNWTQRIAYDWAGSWRYLPQPRLERFINEYQKLYAEHESLYKTFEDAYPTLIAKAAFTQGDMFNRADYPDVSVLRGKCHMRYIMQDVPLGDFRTQISQDLADDLRKHYQREASNLIDQIMSDAAQDFLTLAERLRNACTEVTTVREDGKKDRAKKIYESTLAQVKEICYTLSHMNVTQNADLDSAVMQVNKALSNVTLEDLRSSAVLRADVKDELDDVLAKFKPLNSNLL